MCSCTCDNLIHCLSSSAPCFSHSSESSVKLLQLYARSHCKLYVSVQKSSLKISLFAGSLMRSGFKDSVDGQPVRLFGKREFKQPGGPGPRMPAFLASFSFLLLCTLWPHITELFSHSFPAV